MAKILLETEAASIGGEGGAVDKKCCTKSRAVALGCKVDGDYLDNRLIPQGSASKAFVSPEVQIHIISNRPLSGTYLIVIYINGKIYLNTSNTYHISGNGSRELLGSYYITDTDAIGKTLSVSFQINDYSKTGLLEGFEEWELNGSNVPTNTIVLHEGDIFDVIFTDLLYNR